MKLHCALLLFFPSLLMLSCNDPLSGPAAPSQDSRLQRVAVGDNGTVITSTDGINWSEETTPTNNYLSEIAYDGSQWITVGESGVVLRSPDAKNWTPVSTPATGVTLEGIDHGGGVWIAVGNKGMIIRSVNGTTWEKKVSGTGSAYTPNGLFSVAYHGNKWIAVGLSGSILHSLNSGVDWTVQTSGINDSLTKITGSTTIWVTAGLGGLYNSEDGIGSWMIRETNISATSTWYERSLWVAVGMYGDIWISTDGISWAKDSVTWIAGAIPRSSITLEAVTYGGNQWIAVGSNGTIIGSTNGQEWTNITSPVTEKLNDIIIAE